MGASFPKPGKPRRIRATSSNTTGLANRRTEVRPSLALARVERQTTVAPERVPPARALPARPTVVFSAMPQQGVATFSRSIPGPPGPAGGAQVFEFDTPSAEWVCPHNLGRLPLVTVYDLQGNLRPFVPLTNPDLDTTVLTPSPPLAGKAVIG